MEKDNGRYPEWQKRLRELQAQRDEEVRKRQQEAAEMQKKAEAEQKAKDIRDLKTVLGFLGIEAEPTDDYWKLDDYVFYGAALRIRTLNNNTTQYDWSVRVARPKDQALLAWYDEEDRDQYTLYYEDDEHIVKPSWPSICVKTLDYRDEGQGWQQQMVMLADGLDQLDEAVKNIHSRWEADRKAFEERKERAELRAEEQARQEEKRRQEQEAAAQTQDEAGGDSVVLKPLPLEERLIALLREFIQEAARIPEY